MNEAYEVCPYCFQVPCEFFIGQPCSNKVNKKVAKKAIKVAAAPPDQFAWNANPIKWQVRQFYEDNNG